MAQLVQVISDTIALGASGVGTYTAIDEISFSDADYISSNDNTNVVYEALFAPVTDPGVNTGHIVRWRQAQADGNVAPSSGGTASSYDVLLYQGTTLIATCQATTNTNESSFLAGSYTLSAAEADSITNYSDLRFHVDMNGGGGSPAVRRGVAFSWAQLEVPDAGVPVTVNLGTLNFAETLQTPSVTAIGNVSTTLGVLSFAESLQTMGVTAVKNNSVTLGTLNFTTTQYDISAGVSTIVNLGTLNFSETLQTPGVSTGVGVSLGTLNFAETLQSPTVDAEQNVSVSLGTLNFSETLNTISVSSGGAVTVDLGVLNFSGTLNDISVVGDSNVALDTLNFTETLQDITVGTSANITVNLGTLNFSENTYDITAIGEQNAIVTLDTLNFSETLYDASVTKGATVNLGTLHYDLRLATDFNVTITRGGISLKLNVGADWKDNTLMKLNVGGVWKDVIVMKINTVDGWKDLT